MPTRVIDTPQAKAMLIRYIEQQKPPFIAAITHGGIRTLNQNRLAFLWFNEIAEQLGDRAAEDVRAECKLTFGVPIMRAENTEFREAYDRVVKHLPYEDKIKIMANPLDLPVTRLMTVKQHTAYLDAMHRHFTAMGIVLTDPGDLLAKADAEAMEERQ